MTEKQRHPTLSRLFYAAKVASPSALAKAMNESEQAITNWAKRGVSKEGAIKAEHLFGRSAGWVLTGNESKSAATTNVSDIASRRSVDSVDSALRVLAEAINKQENRDGVAGLLSNFARNTADAGTYAALLALLDSGNDRRQTESPPKFSRSGGT